MAQDSVVAHRSTIFCSPELLMEMLSIFTSYVKGSWGPGGPRDLAQQLQSRKSSTSLQFYNPMLTMILLIT